MIATREHFKTLRAAAKKPVGTASEHSPNRAKLLREAVRKTGKQIWQLTASELIAINKTVDEKP